MDYSDMTLVRFVATASGPLKQVMDTHSTHVTLFGSLLLILMSCVTSYEDSKYGLHLDSQPLDIHNVDTRSRNSGDERFRSLLHAQENGYLRGWTHQMRPGRVEKLPWMCECEHFWRDLGNGYKPRFIRDSRCKRSTCMYGHYNCVPQMYEVQVLRQIREDNPFEYDTRIANYAFTSINVTANCLCDRA